MNKKEVHICPILMRTVIWEDEKCTEDCGETDCPIQVCINNHSEESKNAD